MCCLVGARQKGLNTHTYNIIYSFFNCKYRTRKWSSYIQSLKLVWIALIQWYISTAILHLLSRQCNLLTSRILNLKWAIIFAVFIIIIAISSGFCLTLISATKSTWFIGSGNTKPTHNNFCSKIKIVLSLKLTRQALRLKINDKYIDSSRSNIMCVNCVGLRLHLEMPFYWCLLAKVDGERVHVTRVVAHFHHFH